MLRHTFRNPQLAALAACAARTGATMANPVDIPIKLSALPEAEVEKLRTQVNLLTASLRILTAKLDADAGVTDTTYRSLISDLGVGTAPATLTVL